MMDGHLQSENFSLRQQLELLLHEAQRNEDKMRRFDRLERRLIGAGSLVELIGLLLSEYRQAFAVEYVTLALVDRDYEVTRILDSGPAKDQAFEGLKLFQSRDVLETLYGETSSPCLGDFDPHLHQVLFDAPYGAIASVALLPLFRQGELIGSLHFGSASAERYARHYGTDFLERLAEVVAICIESSLSQERLKQLGLTDQLTGVQNRRYFEHRCAVEISQACRYKHPLACMFLDIDKFKRINDTYGHQTGDEVLRCVAKTIQGQLRSGDTIARYGGEEFVVLLPQSEVYHAFQIAERIRRTIENMPFQTASGQPLNVTISIGLSALPSKASSMEQQELASRLVAAADQALYQAKNTGRNRVVFEGQKSSEKTQRTLAGWLVPALMSRLSSLTWFPALKRLARSKA